MLRFRCTTSTYISTISDSDLIGTLMSRERVLALALYVKLLTRIWSSGLSLMLLRTSLRAEVTLAQRTRLSGSAPTSEAAFLTVAKCISFSRVRKKRSGLDSISLRTLLLNSTTLLGQTPYDPWLANTHLSKSSMNSDL